MEMSSTLESELRPRKAVPVAPPVGCDIYSRHRMASFSLALSCDSNSLWRPEVAQLALESGALLQAIASDDPEEREIGRDAWATVFNTAAVVARARSTLPGSVCFLNLHANAPALRLACVFEYRGPCTRAAACILSMLPCNDCQFYIRLGFGESALTSGFSDSELGLKLTPADHAALRRRGRVVDVTVAEEDDEDELILSRSACKRLIVSAVQEATAAAAAMLLSANKGVGPCDGKATTEVSSLSPPREGDPFDALIPAAYLRNMLRCCVSALAVAFEAAPTPATSPMKILALGTGAGVLPLVLLEAAHRISGPRQVECCCVDDSEGALTIAHEWFGLGSSAAGRTTLVLDDAAAFVRREAAAQSGAAGTYAVIAVDLYSNGSWPVQAVGEEFWAGVAALLIDKQPAKPVAQDARQTSVFRLSPPQYDAGPVVVVNLDPLLACFDAVCASLRAAFEDVCVASCAGGGADLAIESNVVVVARTRRKIAFAAC